jgi:hypothetical protein
MPSSMIEKFQSPFVGGVVCDGDLKKLVTIQHTPIVW